MIKLPPKAFLAFFLITCVLYPTNAQNQLTPDMVFNLSGVDKAWYLFDNNPATHFVPRHKSGFQISPITIIVRMKPDADCALNQVHFAAEQGAHGQVQVFAGQPGQGTWQPLAPQAKTYGGGQNGFTLYTNLDDIDFLKFVFTEKNGFESAFGTGEINLSTSGDCAYTDILQSAAHRKSSNTFDDYMGVNHFVGKSTLTEFYGPFKNVREYLPWDHIQGHPSGGITSSNSNDHPFHFVPCFPGYDLDDYYGNLKDMGKLVLGDFKESAPFQMYFDYEIPLSPNGTAFSMGLDHIALGGNYLPLMERKPGHPTEGVQPNNPDFCSPDTYTDHADALYQVALRYGKNGDPQKARFADTQQKANQGLFSWIENWNEQDKWWNRPTGPNPIQTDKEHRLSYFTPEEYMAMTAADAAPSEGDLALPLIMSGISELDETYLRGMYMAWWELTGTNPAETFPFYALNFHHYGLNQDWSHCIMPEADTFFDGYDSNAPLARIVAFTETYLPHQKIWLSEFGYSDHPNDNTSATPNYPNADHEETQAAWLMRGFLHLYRFGIDRAFTYQLTDEGPNAWYGMFNHTGMIDRTDTGGGALPEYRKKKAWYYLFTLQQSLEGKTFSVEQNLTATDGRPVRCLTFLDENNQKTHVLWIPQAENPNPTTLDIQLSATQNYQIIQATYGSIAGITETVPYDSNTATAHIPNISETPLIIIEDAVQSNTSCACAVPLHFAEGDQQAAEKLTDEFAQIAVQDAHPRCAYGKNANSRWDGAAATTTLDIGQQGVDDLWHIEGVYIHDPMGQEGQVNIEFLDENDLVLASKNYFMDGNAVYPFTNFGVFHVWKRFEDIDVKAAKIRLSKAANAAIGEIILCATPAQACVGDGQVPSGITNAQADPNGSAVTFDWDLPSVGDIIGLEVKLLDSVGAMIKSFPLPAAQTWTLSSDMACGKTYSLQVATKDCEGLQSAPITLHFKTADCVSSPPVPSACACEPQILNLNPAQTYYELTNNQSVPVPNISFFDACYDQAADKSPFRLVDEQNLTSIARICTPTTTMSTSGDFNSCQEATQGGFPLNECFAGWDAAQYPYHAVLEFDSIEQFNGVYIYDSNDDGALSIAYRPTLGTAWESLELGTEKTRRIRTDQWRTWRLISFSEEAIKAHALRVTFHSPNARIAEILLCSKEPIRRDATGTTNTTSSRKKRNPKSRLTVQPNPTTDIVQIQSTDTTLGRLSLFDTKGQLLWEKTDAQDASQAELSLGALPAGVYFLKSWTSDGDTAMERVVLR